MDTRAAQSAIEPHERQHAERSPQAMRRTRDPRRTMGGTGTSRGFTTVRTSRRHASLGREQVRRHRSKVRAHANRNLDVGEHVLPDVETRRHLDEHIPSRSRRKTARSVT